MTKRAAQDTASPSPAKKQKNSSDTATPTLTSDNCSNVTSQQSDNAPEELTATGRPRRIKKPSQKSQATEEAESTPAKKTRASPTKKTELYDESDDGTLSGKGQWNFKDLCTLVAMSHKKIRHAITGAQLGRTAQACRIQLHHMKNGKIETSYLQCREAISTIEFAYRLSETNTSDVLQKMILLATAQKRSEYTKATLMKEGNPLPATSTSPFPTGTSAKSMSTWLLELSSLAHVKAPSKALKAKTAAAIRAKTAAALKAKTSAVVEAKTSAAVKTKPSTTHKKSSVRSLNQAASSLPSLAKLKKDSPSSESEAKLSTVPAAEHGWRAFEPVDDPKPLRSTAEPAKTYSARELEAAEALQMLATQGQPVIASQEVLAATALLNMVEVASTDAPASDQTVISNTQPKRSNLHALIN